MYIPALDQIRIPGVGDFYSTSDYYTTFFHELVHSTGHASRLNREGISETQRSDCLLPSSGFTDLNHINSNPRMDIPSHLD